MFQMWLLHVFKPTRLKRSRIRAHGRCTSIAVILPYFPEERIRFLQVLLQLYGVFVVAVQRPCQLPSQRSRFLLLHISFHGRQAVAILQG